MKLHIADNLSLPVDTVTSTLVIYGGKGMGKTNLGSVLVEELTKARLRWCALDPLGVWWGLRHSKSGKGPGVECVILGGVHGDIPIEPTGGAVVADLVVDEPTNVIVDFSRKPSGEMWGVGEKTRFVTEYARRLFQRQGGLVDGLRREPIFQLLDEAARYIPQMIPAGNPDLAKCVSAWDTLVEEGRNVGIGVGLLTQRSARMNKSVSEVADAMFSFRIVGPNSIAAVMDWLGEHVPKDRVNAHIETLRSLERGRCLVVSPGWLRFEGVADVRARETFDSSSTPKAGERSQRVTGEGAKPDLAKYAERMKATIERVKADDPKELRKQLQQLKSDLAMRPAEAKAASQPTIVEVLAVTPTQISAVHDAVNELKKVGSALQATAAALSGALERVQKQPAAANLRPNGNAIVNRKSQGPQKLEAQGAESNGKLRDGAKRMLAALCQFYPAGMPEGRLRSHAGLKKSGTYSAYRADLFRYGYAEKRGDDLLATQSGLDYFDGHVPAAPRTTQEVVDLWAPKLRDGARRMLHRLIEHGGVVVSKEQLYRESELVKSGTASAYLSDLKRAQLALVTRDGVEANRETLFLV